MAIKALFPDEGEDWEAMQFRLSRKDLAHVKEVAQKMGITQAELYQEIWANFVAHIKEEKNEGVDS